MNRKPKIEGESSPVLRLPWFLVGGSIAIVNAIVVFYVGIAVGFGGWWSPAGETVIAGIPISKIPVVLLLTFPASYLLWLSFRKKGLSALGFLVTFVYVLVLFGWLYDNAHATVEGMPKP